MSVCVSVKVAEGLVLAADSTSTIQGQLQGQPGQGILKTYDYASKISQVKDYPVGVASWGAGSVGARTIASLVAEYSNGLPSAEDKRDYTYDELSSGLFTFIKDKYVSAFGSSCGEAAVPQPPPLGMLVAGYGSGDFFPEQRVALLPIEPELKPARGGQLPEFGANWYGLTDAILRLHKGYSPELPKILVSEKGWSQEEAEALLGRLEYPVVFDGMPLQDAVDFAVYLIGVVIGRFRFVVGAPLCGGQIDVAVVTREKFAWVQRKSLRARPLWHS